MRPDIKKHEFLGRLGANPPKHISLAVVHAIVDQVDPILGVAFEKYRKYAEVSATGLRTVARTIPALHRHGLLRKLPRRDGPPVLWLPELMDMQADEALRRAAWLADHKGENPQQYFAAGNGDVAKSAHARATELVRDEFDAKGELKQTKAPNASLITGTHLDLLQRRRAKAKSSPYANDREILGLVHSELDLRGLTPEDPQALTKAIHALGNSRPERFKHLDGRALRKAYQRARARLPVGYERWIGLVKKWDRSYTSQKARNLVDRLVTAISNRPRGILEKLFEHLEQQSCESWSKKVRRLERECEHLETNEYYMPLLRELKKDDLRDRVYAALASGPKTKKQLAESLGRTRNAIVAVGQHLRDAGLIETATIKGRFIWAQVGTAPRFVLSRKAILAALKEGPMNVPRLAEKAGKAKGTIVKALQASLLPNNEVIRTKRGIYALPGTEPPYISKSDAIIAALKEGPMSISGLRQTTSTALDAIYQFVRPLLANRRIIRTKRGVYALPGAAPAFVATDDAIVRALRRRPMRLPALAQRINKPLTTVLSGLARLKTAGTVKHDGWGAEYRLARQVRPVRRRERRKGSKRDLLIVKKEGRKHCS
jgi:predicted transcriptional regulator